MRVSLHMQGCGTVEHGAQLDLPTKLDFLSGCHDPDHFLHLICEAGRKLPDDVVVQACEAGCCLDTLKRLTSLGYKMTTDQLELTAVAADPIATLDYFWKVEKVALGPGTAIGFLVGLGPEVPRDALFEACMAELFQDPVIEHTTELLNLALYQKVPESATQHLIDSGIPYNQTTHWLTSGGEFEGAMADITDRLNIALLEQECTDTITTLLTQCGQDALTAVLLSKRSDIDSCPQG